MLLKELKLNNFRQFYGENAISFSTDPVKNITLIHGENGVGKTTILNAILWCLFEEFTPDFEGKDELISNEALSENVNNCRVELEFEYEGKDYHVLRAYDTKGTSKFKIHEVHSGNFKEIPNALSFINSILPVDMAGYFFFHGEGISDISSKKSGSKFRKAIRDILGFTFAETAIEDLKQIKILATKELKALSEGEKLTQRYAELKVRAEETQLTLENDLKELRQNKENYEREYEKLVTAIQKSGHHEAARLQTEVAKREGQALRLSANLRDQEIEKQSLIQKYAWAIFGYKLANEGLGFIDESSLKGRIPAPYDESLVNDLISEGTCICGRDLVQGTDSYNKVLSMVETANTGLILQKFTKARSVAEKIKGLAKEFLHETGRIEGRLDELHKSIGENDSEIKRLSDELSNINVESINKLQRKSLVAKQNRDNILRTIGSKEYELNKTTNEISKLRKEYEKGGMSDVRIERLTKFQNLINAMIDRCDEKLDDYESSARLKIASDVNNILEKLSRKDYKIGMTEDFEFHLVRSDGKVVRKSKGENLLLNLSFVSALIKLAEERSASQGSFLVRGTVAPFVIDAPFGELDVTYKAATVSFLPTNTKQLILLLSSSHWQGTVDKAIRDKVGSEYLLVSESKVKRGTKPLDEITVGGKTYQQSIYEQVKDATSVREI